MSEWHNPARHSGLRKEIEVPDGIKKYDIDHSDLKQGDPVMPLVMPIVKEEKEDANSRI